MKRHTQCRRSHSSPTQHQQPELEIRRSARDESLTRPLGADDEVLTQSGRINRNEGDWSSYRLEKPGRKKDSKASLSHPTHMRSM